MLQVLIAELNKIKGCKQLINLRYHNLTKLKALILKKLTFPSIFKKNVKKLGP